MSTDLRPLTTGELLDRTFNLYRNNFALFAGIAALAAVVLVAASVLLLAFGIAIPTPGADVDPQTVLRAFAIYFAVEAVFYIVGASLAMGATIYAVSKVYLGKPVTIGESYGKVFPKLGRLVNIVLSIIIRLIGVILAMYVCIFVLVFILGIVFAASGGSESRRLAYMIGFIVGLVGVLAAYVLAFVVYLKYSLAVPASLLENLKARLALKRSSLLSKGSLWRIFLIFLLMGIIWIALSLLLHLPAELLARKAASLALIWQLAATFIAYTIAFPISTIAVSLVYYDQRVRKEAFDLQLMMESLGERPEQAAAAAPIG